jgi:hypothetical protein
MYQQPPDLQHKIHNISFISLVTTRQNSKYFIHTSLFTANLFFQVSELLRQSRATDHYKQMLFDVAP